MLFPVPLPVRDLPNRWRQRIADGRESMLIDTRAAEILTSAATELEAAIATAQDGNRLVSVREFAELRGVRPATVRKWCKRGLVPNATKTAAGDWVLPLSANRSRAKAVA